MKKTISMNLVNLVLINSEKNLKGKINYRRLDTNEIVPKDKITDVANYPIKIFYNGKKTTIKMRCSSDSDLKANALLLGKMVDKEYSTYLAVYCHVEE